jgi:hypothetical protein
MFLSAIRLKAIAALRQETIATTTQRKTHQPGHAEWFANREPHIIPIIANGRAKIECSILIISR